MPLQRSGVELGWGWQGLGRHLDQCEIQEDRTDGRCWQVLTFDTARFLATLTKWKYRAIYRVDDHPAGLWSAEASVSAGA